MVSPYDGRRLRATTAQTLSRARSVRQLDLTVHDGETVAILGASGCGKSTLLRCDSGLVPLDGGELAVDGEIGFAFQEPRLMPWLTVERNVAFAARDSAERARVAGILELVGLANATHLLPKQLSGSMAQRTALARSLVRSSQISLTRRAALRARRPVTHRTTNGARPHRRRDALHDATAFAIIRSGRHRLAAPARPRR